MGQLDSTCSAPPWSVQRRNGDDAACRPGNGIWSARNGRLGPLEITHTTQPAKPNGGTLRRLKCGIYTVDDEGAPARMMSGDRADPLHPPI
jgi:hypothetical protein